MTVLNKVMAGAGLLFALAGSVRSQLPATTVAVGGELRTQWSATNNEQRVSVVADANHTLPDTGLGRRARIGGTMYAYAAAFADVPVATFMPPTDITHWFSLCWTDAQVHSLWLAEPGHNWIFGNPEYLMLADFTFEWLGPSPWDYEQLGASPPEGWQAFFLEIPIPMNPLLIGNAVSVQSYRLDNSWRFYISNEAMFMIG